MIHGRWSIPRQLRVGIARPEFRFRFQFPPGSPRPGPSVNSLWLRLQSKQASFQSCDPNHPSLLCNQRAGLLRIPHAIGHWQSAIRECTNFQSCRSPERESACTRAARTLLPCVPDVQSKSSAKPADRHALRPSLTAAISLSLQPQPQSSVTSLPWQNTLHTHTPPRSSSFSARCPHQPPASPRISKYVA